MNNKDKFHFIAIGGVGQSALAKILLEQGFEVTGSDISESKYVKALKKAGAKIYMGHNEDNIQEGFKIVVSSAIKEDNPEIIRAKELGLEILHRSDMLKILSENCKAFIGFSGTHGKTTTSGLCAYLMDLKGLNPSYAIGGIIPILKTNAKSSPDYKNSYFIAELDESDGTIAKYSPDFLIINNLEADHLDFYKNGLKDIFKTFNTVCSNLKDRAKLIVNSDNKGCTDFLKQVKTKAKIVTFGLEEGGDYVAKNVVYGKNGTSFDVYKKDEKKEHIETILMGEHNVYDALAVAACLLEAGFDLSEFKEHFKTFSGMGRRFEHSCEFDGIEIIDDYSHHPTEIKCALHAAEKYTEGRIVAIFQPHRYTRFKGLFEEFKKSFDLCDMLFVTDVFKAGDEPIEGFESSDFVREINKKNVFYAGGTIEDAGKKIASYLREGDTVLTIGAGDITKMGEVLKNEYRKTP